MKTIPIYKNIYEIYGFENALLRVRIKFQRHAQQIARRSEPDFLPERKKAGFPAF